MNIKILDSWLRDYLKTKATPQKIAEAMSLTSISIERVEPYNNDFVYDIEITTNRPDLASVVGLAREAAAVLPEMGFDATFTPPTFTKAQGNPVEKIEIINDPSLVDRVCAVIMEVKVKPSPEDITERLETGDIRSLNNIIDITNYVMRSIGHPAHVFDFDRLNTASLRIRESKKGEEITTLDHKKHTLPGGDIVAENDQGEIVDLLGIMGLENSVVTNKTKRILLFIDNNDTHRLRKTSMSLGIRTDAVQLNEKGVDPNLAMDALLLGIDLYQQYADGTIISEIIDIYPNKPKAQSVTLTHEKLERVLGIPFTLIKGQEILAKLGFNVTIQNTSLVVHVPTSRAKDVTIPEDIIEEIARVYGYHNLPNALPHISSATIPSFTDSFYYEKRIKNALKYWGFTEVYSYPMVDEAMYEGPIDEAVTLSNPLGEEFVYMRRSLVPSLLKVVADNKKRGVLSIFEIGNVYLKNGGELPKEKRILAGLIKKKGVTFFDVKGIIEQLAVDLGIQELSFKALDNPGLETEIHIGTKLLGNIEQLDEGLINFELNFDLLAEHATTKRVYQEVSKFPPVIEDITLVIPENITTGEVITFFYEQSSLIKEATLIDKFENTRTFHIIYQDPEKNLTMEEVAIVRREIVKELQTQLKIILK